MIERVQKPPLKQKLETSKLLLIRGPKRTGKQSLLECIFHETNTTFRTIDCSVKKERSQLSDVRSIEGDEKVVVFREAQHLGNLGDFIEGVLTETLNYQLVVCCSYNPIIDDALIEALEIEGMLFNFFAPSFSEAAQHFGLVVESDLMEKRLIYGH